MTGIDIPVPEIETSVHQPRIAEVSYLGENEYFSSLQLLCFNKATIIANNPKDEASLNALNNFEIFMTLITDPNAENMSIKRNALLSTFALLFPKHIPQFMPVGNGIFFNNAADKTNFILNESTFDSLQPVFSAISGMNNTVGGSNANFNPKGKKAAEIAAKLMRGRARVAAENGKSGHTSVLARYVSILTVGIPSMSLQDCLNLTVYQLYDLIERYGLYVGWDLDIKSRLAGGKSDSKPDDWMKEIH